MCIVFLFVCVCVCVCVGGCLFKGGGALDYALLFQMGVNSFGKYSCRF